MLWLFQKSRSTPRIKENKADTFSPGSHVILFEGGSNPEDEIQMVAYGGEKHDSHKKKKASQPVLLSYRMRRSRLDQHQQFVKEFMTRMHSVSIIYDREKHGTIRILGRFGKLYYFDVPQVKDMTVNELQKEEDRNKKFVKGRRHFRSSFFPKRMYHLSAEKYLIHKGYGFTKEEKRIAIQLNPSGSKSQHKCKVIQDGHFNFVVFQYPDVKWVLFNMVRMDKRGRDVRIAVESVKESSQANDPAHDPGALIYKAAKILNRNNESTYLEIKPEYSSEVSFIREKITRTYRKLDRDDNLRVEMQLIRSREYSNPNERTGKFRDIKDWREELVIQIEVLDITQLLGSEEFSRDFISLCYSLEDYCKL